MKAAVSRGDWASFLNLFGKMKSGRQTRLAVFERNRDVVNDYWLENGLPLVGIDVDPGSRGPCVEITVGNYTHQVYHPVRFDLKFSMDGEEDGIDILDSDGRTTLLRLEAMEPPS
jgi:hypothetical protein